MNKMVINHLDRLFVTSDAAVIVRELEVAHPAAKLLVMAAQAQEQEIGDGTNLVVTFGGELLGNAEELIRDGLHPSEIIEGYETALGKTLEWLDDLVVPGSETLDIRDARRARPAQGHLSSSSSGTRNCLAKTCAEACIDVCPKNALNFNVDNVRWRRLWVVLHENRLCRDGDPPRLRGHGEARQGRQGGGVRLRRGHELHGDQGHGAHHQREGPRVLLPAARSRRWRSTSR